MKRSINRQPWQDHQHDFVPAYNEYKISNVVLLIGPSWALVSTVATSLSYSIVRSTSCCKWPCRFLPKNIYQRQKGQSPPSLSLGSTHPTSLCLLCRQLYRRTGIVRCCRQSGQRLGECFLRTTKWGTDPSITDIYSLLCTLWQLNFASKSLTFCVFLYVTDDLPDFFCPVVVVAKLNNFPSFVSGTSVKQN